MPLSAVDVISQSIWQRRVAKLRVHCAALGLPIVNDPIYPALLAEGEEDHARPLQLLAKALAFTDPVSGESRSFDSRLRLSG